MTLTAGNALLAGQIAAQINAINAALLAIQNAPTTIPNGVVTGLDYAGSNTSMNLLAGINLTASQTTTLLSTITTLLNQLLTAQQNALAAVPYS